MALVIKGKMFEPVIPQDRTDEGFAERRFYLRKAWGAKFTGQDLRITPFRRAMNLGTTEKKRVVDSSEYTRYLHNRQLKYSYNTF